MFNGPYKVDDGFVERRVVLTNKTPIGAYRGYGQPEVNFAYERLMDQLARRLGMDAVELRAMNMVKPDEFPWVNPTGAVYDSGDYERCLRMAAERSRLERASATRDGTGADGRFRGVGFSSYVERTGYASAKFLAGRGSQFGAHESVTVRANRSGGLDVYSGVSCIGQGNETVFAQMAAEFFGCDYAAVSCARRGHGIVSAQYRCIRLAHGHRCGRGTAGGVRTPPRKAFSIAAHMLEMDGTSELEIAGDDDPAPVGRIHWPLLGERLQPSDPRPGLATGRGPRARRDVLFRGAGERPTRSARQPRSSTWTPRPASSRSRSSSWCTTAARPSTRSSSRARCAGTGPGLGGALAEELIYDSETGQLLNGTMMDYFAPTACDLPPIALFHTTVPSPVTPLGVRGAERSDASRLPQPWPMPSVTLLPPSAWSSTGCRSRPSASAGTGPGEALRTWPPASWCRGREPTIRGWDLGLL